MRSLRLLADAVSINQTDIDEKVSQVGINWRFHATADHTIIHLASVDYADDIALERFAVSGRRVIATFGAAKRRVPKSMGLSRGRPFERSTGSNWGISVYVGISEHIARWNLRGE